MSTGYCPTDCAVFTLVGSPAAGCNVNQRKRTLDRIGFFKCDTDLPDPPTQVAIDLLITNEDIVFSSSLANVVMNDPDYEDLLLSDTIGTKKICTKRTLTFEDKFAIAVTGDNFFDYTFWREKKEHSLFLRYILYYSDGSWVIPTDENGNYMTAVLTIFCAGQKLQGQAGTIEVKKGQIDFPGDPIDFIEPYLNAIDLGIAMP